MMWALCQVDCHDGGSTVSRAGRLMVYTPFCLCQGKNVETGQVNKGINQTSGAHRENEGERWTSEGKES